ncbi:LOW QUALITY PROTEIN: protein STRICTOSIDINE SYNTHASE-LIKE 6-like [Phalaenopsis equestris]|uniref:LOW QUALITY PROTEIN: protein STRICTOSIDINE SYNTHASE-LIKE 6-like n=1 Tax=Phalaenopsis equestris TaxID=78828 RepID=UPI0009E2E820|nr:LOW QUALITY PROTEIN: protein STRICTOSIDINE SYNTHASE-LIKE 6-like [Phalaenopsis equestris]
MADPNHSTGHHVGLSLRLLFLILIPLLIAFFLATQLGDLDPVPFPGDFDSSEISGVETELRVVLGKTERVGDGDGLLPGPEDLAYDEKEWFIYTGCNDRWIRRFLPPAKAFEDWAYVGGRPLGVAVSPDRTIVVAEAYKGLLKVNNDGKVNMLTQEAEEQKFKLTDGIDVSSDSLIYFTDASHKYNLDEYALDFLEGRSHKRLMSYDPLNNQTTVLARDLYFPNGVVVSPNQDSLIFCETLMRRCRRYFFKGEKKGKIDKFLENLPGYPDNIKYDGEGQYWIGLSAVVLSAFTQRIIAKLKGAMSLPSV